MTPIIVYLSGGMRGGWQGRVTAALADRPEFGFIDPRKSGTKEFREYAVLDVHGVRRCQIIFAYLEKDNPAGAALVGECGYGKGLGKTVILVNEKNDFANNADHRYLRFGEAFADITFETLDDGIAFLKKFQA